MAVNDEVSEQWSKKRKKKNSFAASRTDVMTDSKVGFVLHDERTSSGHSNGWEAERDENVRD